MPRRLTLALAAALGTFALVLQWVLTLQLTAAQGGGPARALWIYSDYFTILTNLLVVMSLVRLASGARHGPLARVEDVTAIATCILIVGLVYNLVLRWTWHPTGWARLADELLHVAMPLIYLVAWWQTTGHARLHRARLCTWASYPVGYLAYALARGALDGRYPYPFLNVPALGYPRVLAHAVVVGLAFVAVGAALAGLQNRRARH